MARVSRSYRSGPRSKKSIGQLVSQCVDELKEFFFPTVCLNCKFPIAPSPLQLCITCEYKLPWTDHFFHSGNVMKRAMHKRLRIDGATSLLYFTKGGAVQNLIHSIKFGGNSALAFELGRRAGQKMTHLSMKAYWDCVVFVPLHSKRLKERGFNQSEEFARGISVELDVPLLKALKRSVYQSSQTNFNREKRWQLLKESFELNQPIEIQGKKILLVDDVFTTGATIEVCGKVLLSAKIEELWILTMAMTTN